MNDLRSFIEQALAAELYTRAYDDAVAEYRAWRSWESMKRLDDSQKITISRPPLPPGKGWMPQ